MTEQNSENNKGYILREYSTVKIIAWVQRSLQENAALKVGMEGEKSGK